jgi:hypothetical protein
MFRIFLALKRKPHRSPRLVVVHYGSRQPSPWTALEESPGSAPGSVDWEVITREAPRLNVDPDSLLRFIINHSDFLSEGIRHGHLTNAAARSSPGPPRVPRMP